ncbi:MAG: pyrimidine dimer DNA glycosylase/endonuclease V [Candidatus Pacearchaeota archaeon]|jgi:deoxyribonuclease (pyrimidine dimer)
MVRINLINPKKLADQHLIAEYSEILILVANAKKYPNSKIPKKYCLGIGHICFFKDKIIYLKNRHELLRKEMKKRGFKTNKQVLLKGFNKNQLNNWKPKKEDINIIKKRIIYKISLKPKYYRYYKIKRSQQFLKNLIKSA